MTLATAERPVNYLRPHQVEALTEDRTHLEETLATPGRVSQDDVPALRKRLRNTIEMLETQRPTAPRGESLDAAVRREAELREQIALGMPTQAEMRRNPPGAVSKHRGWEKRNKAALMEWKNLRLRLHAAGAVDDGLADASEVANFERYRPAGGAQEMNLDAQGTQIPGKRFFLAPSGAPNVATVFSEDDLKAMGPQIAGIVGLLDNEQRAALKAALAEPKGK